MSSQTTNRRFGEIALGILLVLFALSGMFGDSLLAIGIGVLGFFLIMRQMEHSRNAIGTARGADLGREMESILRSVEREAARETPAPRADQVYQHALDAVANAGLDPFTTHVLPVDIGVMSFSGEQDPVIYRTRSIPDDVDYIQPFVQLRLPTRAIGRVRFEILDSDRQVLFIHEDYHEFERGRNLITPTARLPIHDAHNMRGDWELRVSADGVLLAAHTFTWQESKTAAIRRHLREDGEISSEMRAMMAESRLQRMSLDDLLASQFNEEEQDASRRRASR
ncbi:MAG: hypothetical protein SNJ59_13320 [Aggregatilineales bacterium]